MLFRGPEERHAEDHPGPSGAVLLVDAVRLSSCRNPRVAACGRNLASSVIVDPVNEIAIDGSSDSGEEIVRKSKGQYRHLIECGVHFTRQVVFEGR